MKDRISFTHQSHDWEPFSTFICLKVHLHSKHQELLSMGIWVYPGVGSRTQQSTGAFNDERVLLASSVDTGSLISPSPECSSNFDLALLFEDGALSMVASALFVVLATLRLLALRNRKDFITNNWLLKSCKLVSGRLGYSRNTKALKAKDNDEWLIIKTDSNINACGCQLCKRR